MAIKLRTLVKHPARVEGGTGITITKANGIYTFDLDLAEFVEVASVRDESATSILLVTPGATDDAPDVVERISVDNLLTDVDAVVETRQIISGAGLAGGGDLSADRTLAVGAGTGITVNADGVALDIASTRNTDHASVTLTAGAGLTGGGDITASRSFAIGAGSGITVNANDVALAPIAGDRIMANISSGSAAPGANTLTAILDAIVSNVRGTILVRGVSSWGALALGSDGQVLHSDGTDLVFGGSAGLPNGYISERRVEINSADSEHDVDFYPFAGRDSTDSVDIIDRNAITKRIDTAWAVGDGSGGLDVGSVGNDTWYYCYRIRRSDTGVIDALFSSSATSPMLPLGYDSFQLQGAVLTDGSANLVPFTYVNGAYYLDTAALDHSVTLGTSATDYALRVPRIQGVIAIFEAYGFLSGTASVGWRIVPGFRAADIANAGYVLAQEVDGMGAGSKFEMQVNGVGEITANCTSAGSTFQLRTWGWYF